MLMEHDSTGLCRQPVWDREKIRCYNQIFVGTPELEVEGDPFSQQRELAAALQSLQMRKREAAAEDAYQTGYSLRECADSVSSLTGSHSKQGSDDGGMKGQHRQHKPNAGSSLNGDSLVADVMQALFWVALIAAAFLLFGAAIFQQQRRAEEDLLASEQAGLGIDTNMGA